MARMNLHILYFMAAILPWLAPVASTAEAKRVALVIGNSAYTVGPLANPVKDAKAVARLLDEIGFDKVILRTNLGRQKMQEALSELADAAVGSEVALVFYAGHGTENAGVNYLIPTDAPLARAADLKLQTISLDTVIDQIAGASHLKLVILDACRNNIFPLAGSTRSQTRGLARTEPEDNTLVAYAAKAGTTADDGSLSNSPFTAALLRHLPTPGLDVRLMLGQVRDDVVRDTAGTQLPHVYGTLGGEQVYIAATEATAASARPAGPDPDAELRRLRAEIEELRRKQSAASIVAELPAPSPAPKPSAGATVATLQPAPKPSALPEARPAPAAAMAYDEAAGRAAFKTCGICHKIGPAATNSIGPSLNKIMGRKAGSTPGYNFSAAMSSSTLVWNESTLLSWVLDHHNVIPGNKMIYPNKLQQDEARQLVEYIVRNGGK